MGIGVHDYIFLEATVLSISTTYLKNYVNVFKTENQYLNQGKLFPPFKDTFIFLFQTKKPHPSTEGQKYKNPKNLIF